MYTGRLTIIAHKAVSRAAFNILLGDDGFHHLERCQADRLIEIIPDLFHHQFGNNGPFNTDGILQINVAHTDVAGEDRRFFPLLSEISE